MSIIEKTNQEIFDIVYKGMASQGFRQSVDSNGRQCMYRAPNGLRCAIGWLIPDEKYNPLCEGHDLVNALRLSEIYIPKDRLDLTLILDDLQDAHDTHGNEIKEALEDVARQHSLTIPEIKEVQK